MKVVNALKVRNSFGEVLSMLRKDGEPILVSKGKKIEAVLITPEQFQQRFLDFQAEERKKELFDLIQGLRDERLGTKTSLALLREIRGYDK